MTDTRSPELFEKMQAMHNKLAPEITEAIVRPIMVADGDVTDVLVLLESVVAGVIAIAARKSPESRDVVLNALVHGVKQRFDTLPESFDREWDAIERSIRS